MTFLARTRAGEKMPRKKEWVGGEFFETNESLKRVRSAYKVICEGGGEG